MRDISALNRSGVLKEKQAEPPADPRIHVDLNHLRSLSAPARHLNFLPRQAANSILNGRHHSKLRGRGLNFEELRNYLPGDDSRTIDWKVTARTGTPYVRVYTEERDRPTLMVVDQRMSMFFGSTFNMKSVTAAEAAALVAFRMLFQGDRIGGIIFNDDQIKEFKPLQSSKTLDAFLTVLAKTNRSLNANKRVIETMSLNKPLQMAARLAKNNHIVTIFSDFDNIDDKTEHLLASMSAHNDVILVLVSDPIAHHVSGDLKFVFSDGIMQSTLDTSDVDKQQKLSDYFEQRFARIYRLSEQLGIPVLPLSAGEPTLQQIRKLLGM